MNFALTFCCCCFFLLLFFFHFFPLFFISGIDSCCQERLRGFVVYGEPGHAEIYDDGKETSSRYAEAVIDIAIPEEYRYTKFSNITISVTTLNERSTLTLCEVEVFSGKLFLMTIYV